jgi:hypothetical protein
VGEPLPGGFVVEFPLVPFEFVLPDFEFPFRRPVFPVVPDIPEAPVMPEPP